MKKKHFTIWIGVLMVLLTASSAMAGWWTWWWNDVDVLTELVMNSPDGQAVFKVNNRESHSVGIDQLRFDVIKDCGDVSKIHVKNASVGTCFDAVETQEFIDEEVCEERPSNASFAGGTLCRTQTRLANVITDYVPYACNEELTSIPPGVHSVKIEGDIVPAKCSNQKLGYFVDWIPTLNIDGYEFSRPDWAVWNSSYLYYTQNFANHTLTASVPNEAVANIVLPYYLRNTSALFTAGKVKSDCSDVLVNDSTGILSCDFTQNGCRNDFLNNSQLWVWCKGTGAKSGQHAQINYGNPASANQSTTGSTVWSSNAWGIWLMDQNGTINASSILDHSGNSRHLQPREYGSSAFSFQYVGNGGGTQPTYTFGGYWNYTGAGGAKRALCLPATTPVSNSSAGWTLEFWVTHTTDCTAGAERLFEVTGTGVMGCALRNGTFCDLRCWTNSGSENIFIGDLIGLGLNNGSMHQIVYERNATNGVRSLYWDGVLKSTTTAENVSTGSTASVMTVGQFGTSPCTTQPGVAQQFDGGFHHVEVYTVPKGADWVAMKYKHWQTLQAGEEVLPNSAPIVTISAPSNGTNSKNVNFTATWNATDDQDASFPCTLKVNDTLVTPANTTLNGTTTFRLSPNLAGAGAYQWFVNCSDSSGQQGISGNFTYNVVPDLPPNVTTPLITPNPAYWTQDLNCSTIARDEEDATISVAFNWYRNGINQTGLGNVVSCTNNTVCTTGLTVNYVNTSERYECLVTPFDSAGNTGTTQNSTVLTVRDENATINTVLTTPIYEANSTFYQLFLNKTGGISNLSTGRYTIWINGTYYSALSGFINNTVMTFNVTINQTILVPTNQTVINSSWNGTYSFTNGLNFTNQTANSTQTVIQSFILENISLTPVVAIEGETVTINVTIRALSYNWNLTSVRATYDGGIVNMTLASNTTNTLFSYTGTNVTKPVTGGGNNNTRMAYANMTFFSTSQTVTRESVTGNATNTISIITITDCGTGNLSQTAGLRFDIYDEDNPFQRLTVSTTEEGYTIYASNPSVNRTIPFNRTNVNNWSICIYPNTTTLNIKPTVKYGNNSVSRTFKSFFFPINSTQTNRSLFFLNTSQPLASSVLIKVQNRAGIAQSERQIDVERYYIGENLFRTVTSDVTDVGGQIQAFVRLQDTDYRINVSQAGTTLAEKVFGPLKILSSPLTLTLGANQINGFIIALALRQMNSELVYDNTTKQFTLSWTGSGVAQQDFSINQVCLKLERRTNQSSNLIEHSVSCKTFTTSTNSITSIPVYFNDTQYWTATGYANITSSPAHQYLLAYKTIRETVAILGREGVFWASMTILTVLMVGVWNPVVAIFLAFASISLIWWSGLLIWYEAALVIVLMVIAAVISYRMKA